MAKPITIERKGDGTLAPQGEGRVRPMKKGEKVTFARSAGLEDLVITFENRSPFSDTAPHTFKYDTEQAVVKDHAQGPDKQLNKYTYVCHEEGKPPLDGGGGEIIIEPGT